MADLHPIIQALRPYLNAWAMDHQDQVLAALAGAVPPPPGVILAPSHYICAQAARILEVTPNAINDRIARGTLPIETWFDTKMIPAAAVAAALRKRRT